VALKGWVQREHLLHEIRHPGVLHDLFVVTLHSSDGNHLPRQTLPGCFRCIGFRDLDRKPARCATTESTSLILRLHTYLSPTLAWRLRKSMRSTKGSKACPPNR
jgi:hypothetical protein